MAGCALRRALAAEESWFHRCCRSYHCSPASAAIMNVHNVVVAVFAMSLSAGLSFQTRFQSSSTSLNSRCVVKAAGVQFNCPAGWQIVEENERGTTIGNFERQDKTGNLTTPAGRATITVHPMPEPYKNLREWIFAASKIAPDASQTNETLNNKTVGAINLVCFISRDSQRGWVYASYFFEINGKPVNLELNYQRTSPNASEYRAILNRTMESLQPISTN